MPLWTDQYSNLYQIICETIVRRPQKKATVSCGEKIGASREPSPYFEELFCVVLRFTGR